MLSKFALIVSSGSHEPASMDRPPSAAAYADRVVFMADGRLAGELHAPTAEQVAERMTGLGE